MVLAGQYLERSVVVGDLDALYHRGTRAPPCAIAAPHPALGGSMLSPVVAELAWALTRAGHPTMRFDYRGVGSSRGVSRHEAGARRIVDLRDEIADLLAVSDQLIATTGMKPVCAVGYSFGAAVALEAARNEAIGRLVLIAPPTQLFDFGALVSLQKPVLVVCAHLDPYCDRGALRLPSAGRLEVIPHADHFFGRGLTQMGKTVAAWVRGDRPELAASSDEGATAAKPLEFDLDPAAAEPLELEEDPE
jgi:alpha/beta superfamily hydrolase